MAERAEPTRDQIAQDYAKALKTIDGLRTSNAELLAALKRAVETIRAFHDIDLSGTGDVHQARMWELYQSSPEMQAINVAIQKAEGR